VRRQVAALAVVVFAVHLLFLPPTLEDIDSINFALGVREFDVANHQPHPPGYPVYVALARVSAAAAAAWDADDPVLTGLALVSVISGALLVPVLYGLFRQLDPRLGWWAALATTCSPLVWFTAARPLSDMAGLAAALAAQVLCIAAIRGVRVDDERRHHWSPAFLVSAAAMLAGLAAGIRSQTMMLTAPLLLAALAWPRTGLAWRDRAVAVGLAGAAVLLWAVPLVIASGGLGDYLVALGAQGGEDFRGVVMLWTSPHPRVAVEALRNTFVLPWGGLVPGLLIMTLALAGAVVAARRAPAILVLLAVAFGPYAVFHLLFHETATLRYALPLVPPVVFLMLYTVAGAGRAGPAVAGGVVAALSLVWTVPALQAYARTGARRFRYSTRRSRPTGRADIPARFRRSGCTRSCAGWRNGGGRCTRDACSAPATGVSGWRSSTIGRPTPGRPFNSSPTRDGRTSRCSTPGIGSGCCRPAGHFRKSHSWRAPGRVVPTST
jgi:hypothetical protein